VLDVALQNITLGDRIRDVTLTFPRSTHTAIVGPPGSGASTLLQIITGELRPGSGDVHIGTRSVTRLPASRRPLLYVTSRIDAPERWSVRHLLVAAVRQRTLDREDRHHEYELSIAKWKLNDIIERPLRTLSSSEGAAAQIARVELLRPAIVIADRLLENVNQSVVTELADQFYRTLRVIGSTVISAPASPVELGLTDRLVVLDRGRVVQEGAPAAVYRRPVSEAAAIATGAINVIPIIVRGDTVDSPIGSWNAAVAFQGAGTALARPEDFSVAGEGEESDLIFGIEEASFRQGRWIAIGILTGGLNLQVALPGDFGVHKGRLVPLRYDSSRFVLLKAGSR
jgi:putative spermidine/putrescine transport system ATP-binding protein/spermidine/putrescine transport system ATP-binding protein